MRGVFTPGFLEEYFVSCSWSCVVRDQNEPDEFYVFEMWLKINVNNWPSVNPFAITQTEEVKINVMDNCCCSCDLMVAGFFNNYRWGIGTHSIGSCAGCDCSAIASR